jgi:acetolactate synthase I/II/III large subunit
VEGHGGELALAPLVAAGVKEIFTLSGGHIFPIYDACVKQEVNILDVRHEQTAAFGAEAMAKLTRRPGVAVLTAGPGVTNAVSAVTTAWFNGSPLVVLGGRAPQARWGSGSLQELDHVPILGSITKLAATASSTDEIAKLVGQAAATAATPHRGPVFVDFPMDVLFGRGTGPADMGQVGAGGAPNDQVGAGGAPNDMAPDPDAVSRAAALLAGASRPALVAGSDVYWAGAWEELRTLAETLRIPVWLNGLGRGCLPADHELAFARTRSAVKTADVVMVVGTPLDFRLSFGRFGDARVIHVADAADQLAAHAELAVGVAGDLGRALSGMAEWSGARADHESWIGGRQQQGYAAREAERPELESAARPIHPARVYGELRRILDHDAVVVCDGGDFVSYAGKLVDAYQPGCWLDTGPYGCLGTGMGYSIAARVARPDRQVVTLFGDGALGFCGMDADTLVRHGLPVVMVVGNNGIWGLEKHPMRAVYGYDVAADLQPECRYDQVVAALGGAGETVHDPEEIGPALRRALDSGVPYLVNVITDPDVAYPRSSNLA